MELRQLGVFLAVAEELHFGRAADRLGMAQSGVSQTIRLLEKDLGVGLFDRNSRKVRLTPAGVLLRRDATEILGAARRARRHVRASDPSRQRHVRLAAVSSVWLDLMPRVIRLARQWHPEIEISVSMMTTAEQTSSLLDGSLDIGFARFIQPQPGIRIVRLHQEPLMVALPRSHRLARSRGIPLDALAGEDFAMFPRSFASAYFDRLIALCVDAGFSPQIAYECNSDEPQLALVAAGVAVALVAQSTAALHVPDVCFRPLLDSGASIPLQCGFSEDFPSPFLDRLLEVATAAAQ